MNTANPITYNIYTDGGYFHKKDIGGWACVIYQDEQEIYRNSGFKKKTSSLEMELLAAHKALNSLSEFDKLNIDANIHIKIHTDSRILIEGLMDKYQTWCANDWKVKSGKTVVYKELWQKLSEQGEKLKVHWQWVKGHNGNIGNTLADQLARDAALQSA